MLILLSEQDFQSLLQREASIAKVAGGERRGERAEVRFDDDLGTGLVRRALDGVRSCYPCIGLFVEDSIMAPARWGGGGHNAIDFKTRYSASSE